MTYPRKFENISQVEILGRAGTARQLVAGSASSNTPLTADINRISVRAVGADIRFSIGTGTQTAHGNDSNFIANGERLDFGIPAGANIAVIRDGTTNGTLELTELI